MLNHASYTLPDSALRLLFGTAPHWRPMLNLLTTNTGFAVLRPLPELLSTNGAFEPGSNWLAIVSDDESLTEPRLGPSAFDRGSLSWLLARADAVSIYSGAGEAKFYSRFSSLAVAGARVVVIETTVEHQAEWITEVKGLSTAREVFVISPDIKNADACIRGPNVTVRTSSARGASR